MQFCGEGQAFTQRSLTGKSATVIGNLPERVQRGGGKRCLFAGPPR